MSYSLQTNTNSILAQENLNVNQQFQSRTIERLTSGYRINSSGDDAAGLAVANKFRSDTTELTQGIRNANDGISTLEIVDGGLSNISTMLDRLKTLATESASSTFSGNRATLNTEYSTLLTEINRQAANIGLSTGTVGGRYAKDISVYLGGGDGVQANAQVNVNLAGSLVDTSSNGLNLASTNIMGGNKTQIGTAVNLLTAGPFLAGSSETLTFYTADNNAAGHQVKVDGGAAGISGQQVLDQLNAGLSGLGISATMETDGTLSFYGDQTAFSVSAAVTGAGTAIATDTGTASNTNLYTNLTNAAVYSAAHATETDTISVNGQSYSASLLTGDTNAQALTKLNAAFNQAGVYATFDAAGKIELQSSAAFSVTAGAVIGGAHAADNPTTTGSSTATSNALTALTAISNAVTALGNVQGKVGTGQNQLQYAINLAQSQVTSFSAAESRIRDADVAAEAANLTKASVLQQASIAAMAQANSAPQAVLSLLKG